MTTASHDNMAVPGPSSALDDTEMEIVPLQTTNAPGSDDLDKSVALASAQLERIKSFVIPSCVSHMERLAKDLSKIHNATDLITAMVAFRGCTAATRRQGGKIKVQPTSIARRRDGLKRGSSRVPAGRPPVATASLRIRKQAHRLCRSVKANIAHAKGHGAGH